MDEYSNWVNWRIRSTAQRCLSLCLDSLMACGGRCQKAVSGCGGRVPRQKQESLAGRARSTCAAFQVPPHCRGLWCQTQSNRAGSI